MSSIGRISSSTTSLDFSVDLNTASMQSIIDQEAKISDLQTEIFNIEDEIKNDVIGDMGKVVTNNEDGTTTENKTSVQDNLTTLYEMITGVALVTGQEELALPLIGAKELYDNTNHLYETGHSIYESINIFKDLVGHPHSEGEIQDTDEDGNLKFYGDGVTPIYRTIEPTGLHKRSFDLEKLIYTFNTIEETRTFFQIYSIGDEKTYDYRNHLYIESDDNDGEIRFKTKDAYKYNDHNYNWNGYNYFNPIELFQDSDQYFFKDPRKPNPADPDGATISNILKYNCKIGKDGRFYFYHNSYLLTLTHWLAIVGSAASGFYELDSTLNSIAFNVFLNQVQIGALHLKLSSKAVADGVQNAVETGVEAGGTVKSSILSFFNVFTTALVGGGVLLGGILAGQAIVDNAQNKDLHVLIKSMDKDLTALEDELDKINNEIDNIDEGRARNPDNKPYDDSTLTREDLVEIKDKCEETIVSIQNERLEQIKILHQNIGFLHVDYLANSKFQLEESTQDENVVYKLKSTHLDQVIANVGVQRATEIEPTGLFLSIDNINNLIGNKTLTTPPKEASGILGNIEALQNIIGTSEDDDTIISRITNNETDIQTIKDDIGEETIGDVIGSGIKYDIQNINSKIGTDILNIDETIYTRILNNSNNIVDIQNIIGGSEGDSLTTKIDNLNAFTGITDPLPVKSLKEEIDSIRTITGYDDASLLYLLLPPNPDGTIPSIQENHDNNNALIHLGYKGEALNENFSDYFILYIMPHFSVAKDINHTNLFLIKDLVANHIPYIYAIQVIGDSVNYNSALRGYLQYSDIILSDSFYVSMFIKLPSGHETIYKYNDIELQVNEQSFKLIYKELTADERHYLDNVFTDGLNVRSTTKHGREHCVEFYNPSFSGVRLTIRDNTTYTSPSASSYYSLFDSSSTVSTGFEIYPFKNGTNGDYIVYNPGGFYSFNRSSTSTAGWRFNISRNWTRSGLNSGPPQIYIRFYIMGTTNPSASSHTEYTTIYNQIIDMGPKQYQYQDKEILPVYSNSTAYVSYVFAYEYCDSSGIINTENNSRKILFGKIRQEKVDEIQVPSSTSKIVSHSINVDNSQFNHLVIQDKIATTDKEIIPYMNGVQLPIISLTDRILTNNYTFSLGGIYDYRAVGIGNGSIITDTITEISKLSKNNYRVLIPELTIMDEVYIKENLILDHPIQYTDAVSGETYSIAQETSSGTRPRRRNAIQNNDESFESFHYVDELIFRTAPTENQFIYYNNVTGDFEGVNTNIYYTKSDIDGKNYLTDHQSLDAYYTKSQIDGKNYLTSHQSLDAYYTKSYIDGAGYLTAHQSLENYYTKSQIDGAGYLTAHQSLDAYYTKSYIDGAGYLTAHQSLENYYTKSYIDGAGYLTAHQSLENYYTKSYIDGAGYLTAHQSLDDYYNKSHIDTTFALKTDVVSSYTADIETGQDGEPTSGILFYNNDGTSGVDKLYTQTSLRIDQIQDLQTSLDGKLTSQNIGISYPILDHITLVDYFDTAGTTRNMDVLITNLYVNITYKGFTRGNLTLPITNIHKGHYIIFNFHSSVPSSDSFYVETDDGSLRINKEQSPFAPGGSAFLGLPVGTTYHLYRNGAIMATFNIIDEEVSSVFKKEVIPKYVDSISIEPFQSYNINQDLVINFSDDTTENLILPYIPSHIDNLFTYFDSTHMVKASGGIVPNIRFSSDFDHETINGFKVYSITPSILLPNIENYSSQFESVGGLISIKQSILDASGGITITDFNTTQFENNAEGKITIKDSVLGSGGGGGGSSVVNYDDLNVPAIIEEESGTQPVDVIASVEAYTEERMYPPTRNLTSASHTISGQVYGDGTYITNASTYYLEPSTTYEHWGAFSAFRSSDTTGYHGLSGEYDASGVYKKGNYIVDDYLGDWITIEMPQKIKLSKYGFKARPGGANYTDKAPGEYKIYGRNDDTDWVVLVHKTTKISYPDQIQNANDYFEETVSTINECYNHFALVVNVLEGSSNGLNLDEWYIYGKEKLVEPQPVYETQTTVSDYTELECDSYNLKAWYKFDGNGDDSSGNNKHLTEYNINYIDSEIVDEASQFIGTSYYEIANDGYFSPDTFTISVWVNLTGTGNAKAIASCRGTSPTNRGWIIYKYNKALQLWYFGPSSSIVIDNVFNSGWVHLVLTTERTTSNSCNTKIYVNGVEKHSNVYSYIRNTGTNLRIGSGKNENNTPDYYLENNSLIDDFRIYNKVLTPTEIGYLANNMIVNPEYKVLTFPYQNDYITNFQLKAEEITGVVGWKLVKYKPISDVWFSGNDNIQGNYELNHTTKLPTEEWAITWDDSTENEVLFVKGNFVSWLRCNASSIDAGNWTNPTALGGNKLTDNKFTMYRNESGWQTSPYIFDHTVDYTDAYGDMIYQEYQEVGYGNLPGASWPSQTDDDYYGPGNYEYYVLVRNSTATSSVPSNPQTPYTLTFDNPTECDILIVGGGGSGGHREDSSSNGGGGGGAGGLVFITGVNLSGSIPIKVGRGGIGNSLVERGENGKDSSVAGYVSYGGGGGGTRVYNGRDDPIGIPETAKGGDGGSGGGSCFKDSNGANSFEGGSGTTGQGNDGGKPFLPGLSGGGGGAGARGGGVDGITNNNGGIGLYQKNSFNFKTHFNISDTNIGHHTGGEVYFSGGGGGGEQGDNENQGSGGLGGAGGGGDSSNGENALSNTGGGGGGAANVSTSYSGGNGGSGIVIIRYKTTYQESTAVSTEVIPTGLMLHTTTGWALQELSQFPIITQLLDQIASLNARIITLETAGGGGGGSSYTTTIIWMYKYEYDSQFQNLADSQILQLDNTRAKNKLIIQITHISDFNVANGVYGLTLTVSGTQQGNAENIASLPYNTNVLADNIPQTGSPITYEYNPILDSIVIGSKSIQVFRPTTNIPLEFTYKIVSGGITNTYTNVNADITGLPENQYYEVFCEDINLYKFGVQEYEIFLDYKDSDSSNWVEYGKIDTNITSFPVSPYLFSGPKVSGRQYKLMLRLTGVASTTPPLITVIISASTAGFSGGESGGTY